ncbi:MAG: hypothetical protein AAFY42_03260 [Pseudomonadota bacterium]
MQRRIVEPADVSASALAELKSWLGITRPNEDDLLIGLLQAALSMCESFTGQAPLSQLVEERLPVEVGQSMFASRPVLSISKVELLPQNGERVELTPFEFETELQSRGNLIIQLHDDLEGQALVVTATVGLSETWDLIPAPLKQGIIRLCAFHYQERDRQTDSSKHASPPAIVSALWRPWQSPRLT